MDCAQARAHADLFGYRFIATNCHWLFAGSPTPLRSQRTFTGTKEHPGRSRSRRNHAKNASPLGAGAGNRSREESSAAARLLAKNLGALEAAPLSGQNQKLLYARSALSVPKLDGSKST